MSEDIPDNTPQSSPDRGPPAAAHHAAHQAAVSHNGPATAGTPESTITWDAGTLSCGELILQLRRRVMPLPPGTILHVVARDPGAPLDVRAWSRVTGHTLLRYDPPNYWIQRKEEKP